MLPGSDLEGSVLSECALLCLLTVLVPMVSCICFPTQLTHLSASSSPNTTCSSWKVPTRIPEVYISPQ